MAKSNFIISSDPQYPWYDYKYPKDTGWDREKNEEEIKANSDRQIRQQYESMNELAKKGDFKAVLINGDFTRYGNPWELKRMEELCGILDLPLFIGLGNHDYSNNVTPPFWAPHNMVQFMWAHIKQNQSKISNFDFTQISQVGRTDYVGSLSYSFDIQVDNNKNVHMVQLHNYPAYNTEWVSPGSHHYHIRRSFYWLENDLAIARNRGDIIIVNLHDRGHAFKPGPDLKAFDNMMIKYKVSAVFAGHIHSHCKYIEHIGDASAPVRIPFFRSGAAALQDYLIAEIDPVKMEMAVKKMKSKKLKGVYNQTDDWPKNKLHDGIPQKPMPVPSKEVLIVFYNKTLLRVTKFCVEYKVGDKDFKFDTKKMDINTKQWCFLPPEATNIEIWGDYGDPVVGPWIKIFTEKFKTTAEIPLSENTGLTYVIYDRWDEPDWGREGIG